MQMPKVLVYRERGCVWSTSQYVLNSVSYRKGEEPIYPMNDHKKLLSRRQVLKIAGLAAGGTLLAACGAQATPAAPAPVAEATKAPEPAAPVAEATAVPEPTAAPVAEATAEPAPTEAPVAAATGRKMPDDAAPIEQQVFVQPGDSGRTYLDATMSIYNAHMGANLHNMPPVAFNHDFELVPRAAKSWKVSEDGKTWAFALRDDIKWTDGKSLNADDFVAAIHLVVDKDWAHDFNWYYAETKLENFAEVTKGEKKLKKLAPKRAQTSLSS